MRRALAAAAAFLLVAPLTLPAPADAQATAASDQPAGEELILTIRANRVERGEFTLLLLPDGDFWVREKDLPRLRLEPSPAARRQARGEGWVSLRTLGAASLQFNEAELALNVDFPPRSIAGTVLNLSSHPERIEPTPAGNSLILSYRLASRHTAGAGDQPVTRVVTGDTDLNVRVGGLLLRQATRLDTSAARRVVRGPTQAIWDDPQKAVRYTGGDVVSSAGPFGSAILGAGLSVTKLYEMTPDVVTSPTMSLQTQARLPAEVEVAVDGTPIYRATVGPGPIALNNLQLYGGTRDVRVTVTDVTGRREVIEQPFLFTESVLAQGLHDYNYFVGSRAELGPSNEIRYREAAWQAFHRYGLTDSLTIGAGGEGSSDFSSGGGGITLRSDTLGLLSADLLASHDRSRSVNATGWSARYTYYSPWGTLLLARREFEPGFRSFATGPERILERRETRFGVSTQVGRASLGGDLVRSESALERRDLLSARVAAALTRTMSLLSEYQVTRVNGRREWAAFVYLRTELDQRQWVSTSVRGTPAGQAIDLEHGRDVDQGEGFGYHVAVSSNAPEAAPDTAQAFGSATYNMRAVELGVLGTAPLRGSGLRSAEFLVAGALVGIDGFWGLTRRVGDSFVLARLGVPQPGVEISVNNQVQGRTDARGQLFIPEVGAFGRQDVTLNDKQLGMEYNVRQVRRTIAPPFRSGTVVNFGGTRMRAIAGIAWLLAGGRRTPIAARSWELTGPDGSFLVETASAGDFYLENVPPGTYEGVLLHQGRSYSCRMTVPDFEAAVLELKEGITCE